jgi:arylsulfatase A-like enzyme
MPTTPATLPTLVLAVLGLATCAGPQAAPRPIARPNLVFILFDDLGYGSLGVYGSEFVETPNVDAVARQGMRFTRYYVNGPVCSPTRAALLTGLHPSRLGIRRAIRSPEDKGIPRDVVTLPALLKDRGYATGHVGKWHLGRLREEFSPASKGFDEAVVFHPPHYRDPRFTIDGRKIQVEGHSTELLVDYALDFVRRRAPASPGDPPFFLNLWLNAPHLPLDELPARSAPYPPDMSEKKAYAVLVEDADAQIRRLLDELERLGLAGDTIVVITSDNGGYPLSGRPRGGGFIANAPFGDGKPNVFEGGIRVPLIVRWPGHVKAGAVNDSVVVGSDLLPTIAEIAGASAGPDLYGESFLEALLDGVEKKRDGVLIWEHKRAESTYAVRRGDWKLVRFHSGDRLFDLAADAAENHDLAAAHPDLVAELTREYVRWRSDVSRILPSYAALEGEVSRTQVEGAELFELTGNGGRATLADDARLDVNTDDFTFSAWVRFAAERRLKGHTIAEKEGSWRLQIAGDANAGGRVVLEVTDRGGRTFKVRNGPVAAGRWHQVAFTLFHYGDEAAARVRLYVDPDALAPAEIFVPRAVAPSAEPVVLGAGEGSGSPFVGSIFDPRFYHASLCEPTVVDECPLAGFPAPPGATMRPTAEPDVAQ